MSQKAASDVYASVVVLETNSILEASKKLSIMQKLHRMQQCLDDLEGKTERNSLPASCGVLGELVEEAAVPPPHLNSSP